MNPLAKILLFGLLTSLMLPTMTSAADSSTVELVADLLEAFHPALVKDSSSTQVRRPASAGGVKQNALFEHPQSPAQPARVEYLLSLPAAQPNERILLAFDIAIADGAKLGPSVDGVRFGIEVAGRAVFSEVARETRWRPFGIDLTASAGREVRLALLTEAMETTSYDWAIWGNPRVLKLRPGPPQSSAKAGALDSAVTTGVVAIEHSSSKAFKFRLVPQGGGDPLETESSPSFQAQNGRNWLVKDFDFRMASGVRVEWEPADALQAENVFIAAYPAQPKIALLSATQAVVTAGESVALRVEVQNTGRGKLEAGQGTVELQIGNQWLQAKPAPALAPNETWREEWEWKAPADPAVVNLRARFAAPRFSEERVVPVEVFAPVERSHTQSVANNRLKLEFVRQPGGFALARVLARQAHGWAPVAVWRPLFEILTETKTGEQRLDLRPSRVWAEGRSAELWQSATDADGVQWEARLRVTLHPDRPSARLHYQWKAAALRQVRALLGPNLYVGDGTTGEAKSWGLFPGLESLFGAEPSSNSRDFAPPLHDRRTPHPHKVTIPLMAVTIGPDSQRPVGKPPRFFTPDSLKDQPEVRDLKSQISNLRSELTVALAWDPQQLWDGANAFPSPRFASPNFDQGMANHRLSLFLPSVPEFVAENSERAMKPYEMAAGKVLTLDATLSVLPGPAMAALGEWLRERGGLPTPNPWPRTFQEELDLCRTGFLKTVWDEQNEKWRHCIGWASHPAPGFAALLYLDSHLAAKPEDRSKARDRVALAARRMLRDGGPGAFTSQAGCHIMQWEFPFLYGHLPEAIASAENLVRDLIRSQRPGGGWVYEPASAEQADLGQRGDSVLGTCANRASTLLRFARITGDPAAREAGERALRFMEQFRVPRGGQTWECPMYEPDILAAAYAIRAYHDAFRVTGNERWLHNAVYWAETGVPFLYLWSLPDKPMMLGSAIPVFGSTFYTHSWLGVPVQWCGLVYAYHAFHLAAELEHTALPRTDSPLPLALNFKAADWKRISELITVSATHQQFADGDKAGTYPDSISRFEQKNPAFINPEDILVNVLALHGHDPDVKTARLKGAHRDLVLSSGASIEEARTTATGLWFQLRYFQGEPSHTLVVGLMPREIRVNNRPLARSNRPLQREPGWWWDGAQQRLFLTAPHPEETTEVELVR